ncbi:MAG: ABC transporter substrate-binding protein [Acidimicrobiales bacterium]
MQRSASIVVVVLWLLTGCSADVGAGESGQSTDGKEPDFLDGGGSTRLPLAVDDGDGVLRLAMVRPGTSDPAEVVLTDQPAVILADLLYDGLTEAVGTEGRLRPGLATTWSANDDFTVWTFHLDPSAGLGAQEVADVLSVYAADGGRRNGRVGAGAVVAAGIESVTFEGEASVVVRLAAPNAGLPWVLSGLPFSIVGSDGASTGDYRIDSEDETKMILAARAEAAPGGPDQIVLRWVADGSQAYELLRNGEVDAAVVDQRSFADAGQRFGATVVATSAVRFYVLNADSPVLTTAEARRAVLAAVDRPALISSGFGQQVIETDSLISPSLAGYSGRAVCGSVCAFDPGLATAALASIGPTNLRVAYTGEEHEELARNVTKELRSAGFGARHTALAPDALASVIVDGDADLFAFGWVAPATSSDAVIPPLLAIDSAANIARIDSPRVARLLAEAAVTADDAARWALLADAHRAAMDDVLLLPIAASTSRLVRGDAADSLLMRADGSIDVESVTEAVG